MADLASGKPERSNFLEVGRIDRPHGLTGEVVVTLVSDRPERLNPGSVLFTPQRQLTVAASRPVQHRYLVRFVDVASREDADALHSKVLSAPPIDDPDDDTLWIHEIIGAEVVDQHGKNHGPVVGVLANPASDLLELANGGLIPVVFAGRVDPNARIEVTIPDGLLEDVEEDQ